MEILINPYYAFPKRVPTSRFGETEYEPYYAFPKCTYSTNLTKSILTKA